MSGENNRPQNKPVSLKKRNNATLRDLRNILMQCDPRLDIIVDKSGVKDCFGDSWKKWIKSEYALRYNVTV